MNWDAPEWRDLMPVVARRQDEYEGLRLRAINRLTDADTLAAIVAEDQAPLLRIAAVWQLARLGRQDRLSQLADVVSDEAVRSALVRARQRQRQALVFELGAHGWSDLDPQQRLVRVATLQDPAQVLSIARLDPSFAVRLAAADRVGDDATRQALYVELLADRDSDPEVRQSVADASARLWKELVDRLADEALLNRLAKSHGDASLRHVILQRLNRRELNKETLLEDDDPTDRALAAALIDDTALLKSVARGDDDAEVRARAVSRLDEAAFLREIAQADPDQVVRRAAIARLPDQAVAAIAGEAPALRTRLLAVEALNDQALLTGVARTNGAPEVRAAAIARLSDAATIESLALLETDPHARKAAITRLTNRRLLVQIAADTHAPLAVRLTAARTLGGDPETAALGISCAQADEEACRRLVQRASRRESVETATRWIRDAAELARIARSAPTAAVRLAAAEGIEDVALRNALYLGALWQTPCAVVQRTDDQDLLVWLARDYPWGAGAFGERECALKRVADVDTQLFFALDPSWRSFGAMATRQLSDQTALQRVAERAGEPSVRVIAAKMIDDHTFLERRARLDADPDVRAAALSRLSDPARTAEIARRAEWKGARLSAIQALADQRILSEIVRGSDTPDLRLAALHRLRGLSAGSSQKRVPDPPPIDALATADASPAVRRAVTERLEDAGTLAVIARNEGELEGIRIVAVGALSDPSVLLEIAAHSTPRVVRLAAVQRLAALGAGDALARLPGEVTDEGVRAVVLRVQARQGAPAPSRLIECDWPDTEKQVKDCSMGDRAACKRLEDLARTCRNEDLRRLAVSGISDQAVLLRIARADSAASVRAASVERIGDARVAQTLWEELLAEKASAATKRLENPRLLARLARSHPDPSVRAEAAVRSADATIWADLALGDEASFVRTAATEHVSDTTVLRRVARLDQEASVRVVAVRRVADQALLREVAERDPDDTVRRAALSRLTDAGVVADIARSSPSPSARISALAYLGEQANAAQTVRLNTDPARRREACWKLNDPSILRGSAETDVDPEVRRIAGIRQQSGALTAGVGALGPLIAAAAWDDSDPDLATAALAAITDPALLGALATGHRSPETRRAAALRLVDEGLLLQIALNASEASTVRTAAVQGLKDAAALAAVGKQGQRLVVQLAAVQRLAGLKSDSALADVATSSRDVAIREVALTAVGDDALLAQLGREGAAARQVADGRRRAVELRKKEEAARWAFVGGLGLDYSEQARVSLAAPVALLTNTGQDLSYGGLLGRLAVGVDSASVDLGLTAGMVGGVGGHSVAVPLPLIAVAGGCTLMQPWSSRGGAHAGQTYWGPRVEARFFEVFRLSYARLRPIGGGTALDQWTFGLQAPLFSK
jgi:hypothetical protein